MIKHTPKSPKKGEPPIVEMPDCEENVWDSDWRGRGSGATPTRLHCKVIWNATVPEQPEPPDPVHPVIVNIENKKALKKRCKSAVRNVSNTVGPNPEQDPDPPPKVLKKGGGGGGAKN